MIKFDNFAERGPVRNVRKALNDLREDVRALRIANGKGYTVKRTAIGTVLNITATGEAAPPNDLQIRRFQVVNVKPTYLECWETTADGLGFSSTASYTKVLRPYATLLNDTSAGWDQWTVSTTDTTMNVTRTLTRVDAGRGLTFTWDQRIYPEYKYSTAIGDGDWIFAAKPIKGFSANDGQPTPQQIDWIDLNVDARSWQFSELQQVAVCVDGVTKYMFFMASDIGT